MVCPVHLGPVVPGGPPRRRRRPSGRGSGDASRASAAASRAVCDRSAAASGGGSGARRSAAAPNFADRSPSGRKPSNPAALGGEWYRPTAASASETCCDAST